MTKNIPIKLAQFFDDGGGRHLVNERFEHETEIKPCLRPGFYFLLQSSDCMMETHMLLSGMRVHEHW